jgi:hypothetical protein
MMLRQVAMLLPLRVASAEPFELAPSRRTPAAPAPSMPPPSPRPSIAAASMSSSFGYSCSARSYLREIGRKTSAAT